MYGGLKKPGKLKIKKIEDRIIRDIKNLLEHEGEHYYKPVRVSNFHGNNYFEYESNSDRNKILSIKEYLDEFKAYLKDIMNNLKKKVHRKFN